MSRLAFLIIVFLTCFNVIAAEVSEKCKSGQIVRDIQTMRSCKQGNDPIMCRLAEASILGVLGVKLRGQQADPVAKLVTGEVDTIDGKMKLKGGMRLRVKSSKSGVEYFGYYAHSAGGQITLTTDNGEHVSISKGVHKVQVLNDLKIPAPPMGTLDIPAGYPLEVASSKSGNTYMGRALAVRSFKNNPIFSAEVDLLNEVTGEVETIRIRPTGHQVTALDPKLYGKKLDREIVERLLTRMKAGQEVAVLPAGRPGVRGKFYGYVANDGAIMIDLEDGRRQMVKLSDIEQVIGMDGAKLLDEQTAKGLAQAAKRRATALGLATLVAGPVGLFIGGVASAADVALGADKTACAELGDADINLNENCKPIYKANPNTESFLREPFPEVVKKLKNPKYCSFYQELYAAEAREIAIPDLSDLRCDEKNRVSFQMPDKQPGNAPDSKTKITVQLNEAGLIDFVRTEARLNGPHRATFRFNGQTELNQVDAMSGKTYTGAELASASSKVGQDLGVSKLSDGSFSYRWEEFQQIKPFLHNISDCCRTGAMTSLCMPTTGDSSTSRSKGNDAVR